MNEVNPDKAALQTSAQATSGAANRGGIDRSTGNIALFSAYYPDHGGGMEIACADLAAALNEVGMHVEWVSQVTGGLPRQSGVKLTQLPGTDFIYSLSGVPLPLPMPWALPVILRAVKRAEAVVVVEANFILSTVAFLAAKWQGSPVLLIQHVGKPSTVSKIARCVMLLGEAVAVRPMIRCADAVVYVSPVVARHFAHVRDDPNCLTIGHSLDLQLFRAPTGLGEKDAARDALKLVHNKPIAVFVGRLTESKGVLIIAEIARLRPDWNFVVAGTGPVDPTQWELANVKVLGQLDRVDVAQLYRASDVMILPSPSESFSLVVREALASNCRVLCSDQILETDEGLRPFIVTEKVELSDIEATGERFAAALDRQSGATAQEARAYVMEQCAPDRLFGQYVQLIRGLMVSRLRRRS